MLSRKHPDPLHAAFDNHRLVANGGLLPTSPILRLEVWPESHWPGFALPKSGVLQSYTTQ